MCYNGSIISRYDHYPAVRKSKPTTEFLRMRLDRLERELLDARRSQRHMERLLALLLPESRTAGQLPVIV